MPVIVVTRLRLSDPALFDEFFASAVAVTEQSENSDGNLGADVLAPVLQIAVDTRANDGGVERLDLPGKHQILSA